MPEGPRGKHPRVTPLPSPSPVPTGGETEAPLPPTRSPGRGDPAYDPNALNPVMAWPMISVWISLVPSYVYTDSRLFMWRMAG